MALFRSKGKHLETKGHSVFLYADAKAQKVQVWDPFGGEQSGGKMEGIESSHRLYRKGLTGTLLTLGSQIKGCPKSLDFCKAFSNSRGAHIGAWS